MTRSPHWYYITRYPLGLDATVSGSQSMRFRNDTKHPILIKAYASPGIVRFEIWSVPNGRTVSWSRPSVSNVVRGYDSEPEDVDAASAGSASASNGPSTARTCRSRGRSATPTGQSSIGTCSSPTTTGWSA